jgi:hypothetical protein
MLWAAVSLAAQSILERLPVDASQAGVVGEIVAKFQEQAKWCSHLEASGSRVYDLVLGPVDGRAHLVARLEEAVRQLWVMQDELQALRSSATRIWDLVLERSDEMPSLAVALSSTVERIEGRVDAAATNGVHWEPRLALIAVLLHFPDDLTVPPTGSTRVQVQCRPDGG